MMPDFSDLKNGVGVGCLGVLIAVIVVGIIFSLFLQVTGSVFASIFLTMIVLSAIGWVIGGGS